MTFSTAARRLRHAGALILALTLVLAACGDDASPPDTSPPPGDTTDTTAPDPAAPTTLPEAAPGTGAVRAAWEQVDLTTDLGSDAWTGRVHALWELVPEELPIAMQWIDDFPPSDVGWGVEECHAGTWIGFGAYWRDADRYGQAVPMEEIVNWYSDEGLRAGWTVTAEPFLSAPGTDYEAEGVLIRFEGHGDSWIVRLIEFHGVTVGYCPVAR